ncbi:MAG: YidC/Oxa1 family membrane protein insertase [Bacilli bacterium]
MKKKNRYKIALVLIAVILLTGCTQILQDKNNKAIVNPETGQSLTKNIVCRPTNKKVIEVYNKQDKNILKDLPSCKDFKVTSGGYEGLWTSLFIKPLAFVILFIGNFVSSYGLSIIIISLIIRLIAYPITNKTAMQSELLQKANPDLKRIEEKYKDKTDQESMMKKSTEMTGVYKKYNINPLSGCIYALLQLPLFIAFLEAINRVPAIFEETFLGFQLGTTPWIGLFDKSPIYIILVIITGLSTYFSFKLNQTAVSNQDGMKNMPGMMVGVFTVMSLFMPSALVIYWITTNMFTVVQNMIVKRSKSLNEKKYLHS